MTDPLVAAEAGAPVPAAAPKPAAPKPGRFKAVARMVMAMKRFEGMKVRERRACLLAPAAVAAARGVRNLPEEREGARERKAPLRTKRSRPSPLPGGGGTACRSLHAGSRARATDSLPGRGLAAGERRARPFRALLEMCPLAPHGRADTSTSHHSLISFPSRLSSIAPAAINPTYTYGKRPDSPVAGTAAAGVASGGTPPPLVPPGPPGGAAWVSNAEAGSPPSDTVPARKGHLPTHQHHGHRGSLLTARLPSVGDGLGGVQEPTAAGGAPPPAAAAKG